MIASVEPRNLPVLARTMAQILRRLGDVSHARILWSPIPGTATIDDFLKVNRRSKRGYELVEGTLVRKPMGWKESAWTSFLTEKMNPLIRSGNLGFLTGEQGPYLLGTSQVRMPDVAFMPWSLLPDDKTTSTSIVPSAPHLAVEVLSPSNTRKEMELKRRQYFAAGLKLLWEANPRKRIVRVYESADSFVELTEKDTLDGGTILPGFRLPLSEWFAELDRLSRTLLIPPHPNHQTDA